MPCRRDDYRRIDGLGIRQQLRHRAVVGKVDDNIRLRHCIKALQDGLAIAPRVHGGGQCVAFWLLGDEPQQRLPHAPAGAIYDNSH